MPNDDIDAMLRDEQVDWNTYEEQDIHRVVETLRAAWMCAPTLTLSELLDESTPAPFCELTSSELVDALNSFILQNQR